MKVSIAMVTYNHERFIAQAIESVLMQRVDFDIELVIGEDCSTDRTREIVLDYHHKHPDKIRMLLHPKNMGMGGSVNFVQTLAACQGEYVAMLDGDDYWTSPDKLQQQIDYLEKHPDCSMCFCNATFFYDDERHAPWNHRPPDQKEISTLEDLLEDNFIPTCTVVYRRGLFDDFPEELMPLPMLDWPLHVLNARSGNIGYINESMAAYRIHSNGVWSRLNLAKELNAYLGFYNAINTYLGFEYDPIIQAQITKHWEDATQKFIDQGIDLGLKEDTPGGFMKIFDNWPDGMPLPVDWQARVVAAIYREVAPAKVFASYEAGNLADTRFYWLKTARYAPAWLRNRGVWSIGVSAFLRGSHAPN